MNAPMLFDVEEEVRRPNWDNKILSYSTDEKQILRWILTLHNGGNGVELDPCYSVGRFWEGLPKPKYKYDLNPQLEEVEKADARQLPHADSSIGSVMFDPPFIFCSSAKSPGKIRSRFSEFRSFRELKEMYSASMSEFYRILTDGGLLVFKCQDTSVSQMQYMTHAFVMAEAQRIGFYIQDLFVLLARNVMMSPTWTNGQKHARKAHSYFLVFRKTTSTIIERTRLIDR
jgi:DNA modification methylase